MLQPFSSAQRRFFTESSPVNANYHPVLCRELAALPFTPEMPQSETQNAQPQGQSRCVRCDVKSTGVYSGSEYVLLKHSMSSSCDRQPKHGHYDISSDSEGENAAQRERIPTLRPGQFDGTGS